MSEKKQKTEVSTVKKTDTGKKKTSELALKLTVSSSPHVRSAETTTGIMLDVIISLLPALIASVIIFGARTLAVVATSVISCVLAEYLSRKAMKKEQTITDLSAVVTGILLAYNLPAGIPLYIVVIGAIAAIVVAKQMFGGLGQNFVNPALLGRIVLMVSFPTKMTTWAMPGNDVTVTGATPMSYLKHKDLASLPAFKEMFLGLHGGSLGEVCAAALLLGGIYLVIRKVISPVIPCFYVGTVAILMLIAGKGDWSYVLYEILGGGLLLGAIFMATDYTTSPITTKGKIIYAVGAGCITCLIRLFGSLPEGVSFSIILMNILTPLIDRSTYPTPFGTVKEKKAKKEKGDEKA
jgi:electron transport complex protein RnfD